MSRASSDEVIPGRAAISVNDPGTDVPEGWTRVRLTDVARLESGHTPSRSHPEWWGGDVPWVSLPDAREHHGRVINDTTQKTNELGLAHSAARWLPKNTVCLSRTASVGYVFRLGRQMATSQDFVNWVCSDALEPQFLMQALLAEGKHILNFGMGTTHTTIYFPAVLAFHINLAPLPEQRRIVKAVEALLEQVNRAKERLDRVPAILRRFRHALMLAACSGRLTEEWRAHHPAKLPAQRRPDIDPSELPEIPDAWQWVRLPDLGELARGKSRHRPRNDPNLYGGKYPFIQTGDVARSGGRITAHSQTYNDAGLAQSRLWPKETVCITIAANIAESGLLTYPACFPDSVVGLVANRNVCLPEYAEFFIRTARSSLSQFAPATAQANINLEILSTEVAVPLPPVPEQLEIVRVADALLRFANTIERRVQAATSRVDKLPQAILSKAFSGELVPTEADLARAEGRTYETAAELLARVRRERENGAGASGARRAEKARAVKV